MSTMNICQYGSDVLRRQCRRVSAQELRTQEIQSVISDMIDTMYASNGVGLAAPQVGIDKQIIIIDCDYDHKDPDPIVLINPKILESDGQMNSEEGCLSFRGTSTDLGVKLTIQRFRRVKVAYIAPDGSKQIIKAQNNLLCRCLQHEIDHIHGILFIDHEQDAQLVGTELVRNGFPMLQ